MLWSSFVKQAAHTLPCADDPETGGTGPAGGPGAVGPETGGTGPVGLCFFGGGLDDDDEEELEEDEEAEVR